ncbi:membrane protein [Burkholderiaceae bacterium 16]|nr:membrane protein [Burkholderiaceae bacterium 16]
MGEVITTDYDRLASLRKLTHILYALYAIFWLTGGITALIAIVIGYVKRDDTQGTLYASHFAWQIRSFWWSVAWAILGGMLFVTVFLIPLAFAVWGVLSLWMLYRIVKGWLYLNDSKPMYPDQRF